MSSDMRSVLPDPKNKINHKVQFSDRVGHTYNPYNRHTFANLLDISARQLLWMHYFAKYCVRRTAETI